MERREDGTQDWSCSVVGETDPQPPRATVRNELYAPDRALDLLKDVARIGEEAGARRCKSCKSISLAREQAHAHLLLESGYLFGERRLRDLEPMRGTMKIELSAATTKYRRCRSSTFPCRVSSKESIEPVLRTDRGSRSRLITGRNGSISACCDAQSAATR
jgi:hypothetical protein